MLHCSAAQGGRSGYQFIYTARLEVVGIEGETEFVTSKSVVYFRIARRDKTRIADIQQAVREAWRQMRRPGTTAHANAVACGFDRVELPKRLTDVVTVRPDGAGAATVDMIVVLSGKVAWDIWKYVLLPHIRDIWGDGALKRKQVAAEKSKTVTRAAVRKREPKSPKPNKRSQ